MRARPQIFHTLLACRHSALNHDSASSQLEVDGVSPHPERVSHPLVLARRHRRRGGTPASLPRVALGPHFHLLGDVHDEDAAHARGLLSVLHFAVEGKVAERGGVPSHASLLHRLPRRRLRGSLVRLPAPLRKYETVIVLVRHHEHLVSSFHVGGAAKGNTAGYEPDFIPAPLGMIGDVSLPLASGATHERTRDGARRAVRRRRRGHAHRARHLVTVDFRFERRSRGHRRRPRARDASSGFRRGFFLRERTRALPKSVPRDGTESGVGAGDSRRRLKPVTRYSGEKIRAGIVRSTGRA